MSFGSRINYKQLLERHQYIQIPRIQRDYAQGRSTESEVREEFLNAIQEALEKATDDPTLPLNLDFIYGSVEGNDRTRFLPLDGQQRLTTLFLLHWYLAWRDEQWRAFDLIFRDGDRSRFAYSVRPSSTEFFDALVSYRPDLRPEAVANVMQLIEDQPWYFRSWRLDPTIQSVLGMLTAIHKRFAGSNGRFSRLIDDEHPAITFQLLDLKNFGLSDDLYIKMNARGKPLTAFETFKARYEQELQGQFPGESFCIGQERFTVADYVARRMDTTWADLFWKVRDSKTNLYDDALMNLFRAIALVTRDPATSGYLEDISRLRSSVRQSSYSDFHQYKWLDGRFTRTLMRLLDSWAAASGAPLKLLPSVRYFDEPAFFKQIATDGANLAYAGLVQFAAYAMFVCKHHEAIEPTVFQEWMRIVCNLSVNTDYNRPDDFRRSMVGLGEMLAHSENLLTHFARSENPAIGFSEPQIAEERLKAELILANDDWRPLINRAEDHRYFRGQIGFLIDFCGAVAARAGSEPSTWTADTGATLQRSFERHLRLAEQMFIGEGLNDPGNHRWQRALLSIGNYLLPRGRNRSYLVNSITDEASWKRLLRGTGHGVAEARALLKLLWERLSPDSPVAAQLDAIIQDAQVAEPWRAALVHCAAAFEYCGNTCLRWGDGGAIYLLRRVQMNGAHAELFTYCLYTQLESQDPVFSHLQLDYELSWNTDQQPCITLTCEIADKTLRFRVDFQNEQYRIRLEKALSGADPRLESILKEIGFQEEDDFVQMVFNQSDSVSALMKLDQVLGKLSDCKSDDALPNLGRRAAVSLIEAASPPK